MAYQEPKIDSSQRLGAAQSGPGPGPDSDAVSDPFIIATSQDSIKPNASARKFIRHHVMKGKNKVKKKNRKRTALLQSVPIGSWFEHEPALAATSPRLVTDALSLRSLQITGTNFTGYTVDIQPHMQDVVYHFVSAMKMAMYPVDCCVDLDNEDQRWYNELNRDPSYNQTVSQIAQSYFDIAGSRTFGSSVIIRTNNALVMLQKKLAEADLVVTDSVILTVLALAMMSQTVDDFETAQKHLHGLHRLIQLRGGIKALGQKRLLQIKCCRIDLGFALRTGNRPLFFAANDISWKAYLVDYRKPAIKTIVDVMCDTPDIRLSNVSLDLHELTIALNLAHQAQRKLAADVFQEALISIQYRLHNLSYEPHDIQEMLRLAMLAFSTTLFLDTNVTGLHLQYRPMADKLRTILQSPPASNNSDQRLRHTLWLTYVAKVSVLDAPDDDLWLNQRLLETNHALSLRTWPESRYVLKSFMWVDMVHDKTGKQFFDACQVPDTPLTALR